MKIKLLSCLLLLLCIGATTIDAQTTTIDFSDAGWDLGTFSEFSGDTYTTGNIKFTLSQSALYADPVDGNRSDANSNCIAAISFGTTTLTVETVDKSAVPFQSFVFGYNNNIGIATVEGFRSGTSTGVQSITNLSSYGTISLDQSIFGSVDKIVITSNASGWSDAFDDFIYGEAIPLPVTLQSFTGNLQSGTATLQWTSGVENNFSHYEIQRSTTGASEAWQSLGVISAKGSNSSYTFTTPQRAATAYYRLNMVDNDGASKYSNVITLSQNGGTGVQLYPNPAHTYINIKVSTAGTLVIYNAAGRQVKTQVLQPGVNTVNVSALDTGVYYGSVNGSKVKFIKD